MNASPSNNFVSPARDGGAFSWLGFSASFLLMLTLIFAGCTQVDHASEMNAEVSDRVATSVVGAAPMMSPEELADRLDEPGLVIVHVGHGDRGYQRGHLPGAIYLDFDDIYINRAVAMEMPEAEVIQAVVRRLGIDDDSAVVLVGDASGVFPARFYVTLKHYGLNAELRLLDGQLKGWKAKEFPVVTQVPSDPEPSEWSAAVRPGVLITADDISNALAGDSDRIVLDVRPTPQFTGEKRGPGVDASGRIEGAINVPWRSMFDGSNPPWLKDVTVIRSQLAEAGIAEGDSIMVYDTSGIHASLAMIVLQQLGHEVSLYDGGFEAWSQR